jgi:hypothetical protein
VTNTNDNVMLKLRLIIVLYVIWMVSEVRKQAIDSPKF